MSAVTTKMKGTALVNFTGFKSSLLNGMHIFDPADYVIPPQVGKIILLTRIYQSFEKHRYRGYGVINPVSEGK